MRTIDEVLKSGFRLHLSWENNSQLKIEVKKGLRHLNIEADSVKEFIDNFETSYSGPISAAFRRTGRTTDQKAGEHEQD